LYTGHNISLPPPTLDEQLVLELKVGVEILELLEWLPSSVVFGQTVPLDEDLPSTPTKLSTIRHQKETTIQR